MVAVRFYRSAVLDVCGSLMLCVISGRLQCSSPPAASNKRADNYRLHCLILFIFNKSLIKGNMKLSSKREQTVKKKKPVLRNVAIGQQRPNPDLGSDNSLATILSFILTGRSVGLIPCWIVSEKFRCNRLLSSTSFMLSTTSEAPVPETRPFRQDRGLIAHVIFNPGFSASDLSLFFA